MRTGEASFVHLSPTDPEVPALSRLDLGHYEAARAAALAGVPERTLYQWAHAGLIVPSASAGRQKMWSYGDLLTLRLVRWLRADRTTDGMKLARSSMTEIRRAIETLGDDLWVDDHAGRGRPTILVTPPGDVLLDRDQTEALYGQLLLDTPVDLFAPFDQGPDLRQPRPRLRIVPGKVAGEPHLVRSRLTTRTVGALADRGFPIKQIASLYPSEDPIALGEAVELEQQLAG